MLAYHEFSQLEAALRAGPAAPWLRFSPELELIYRQTRLPTQSQRYRWAAWAAMLFINFTLLIDHLLLPGYFEQALMVRLGFCTPLMLIGTGLLYLRSAYWWNHLVVLFMIGVATFSHLAYMWLIDHPNILHYHHSLILVVLFSLIIVRLPLLWSLSMVIGVLAIYMGVSNFLAVSSFELTRDVLIILSLAAVMGMMTVYQMEREDRRQFAQQSLLHLNTLRLEQANADLDRLSRLDALTDIANRRCFDEALDVAWRTAQRKQGWLSVILIDVDHFKAFNDQYGHAAGDHCLQQVAHALMGSLFRAHDLVARYGGEEFVVLLPETGAEAAQAVAERLLDAVRELQIPHDGNSAAAVVTFSAGVACVQPQAGRRPESLLSVADAALYSAKAGGRNRVCVAEPAGSATGG